MNKNLNQESWKFKLFAYMASQGISLLGSTVVSFAVMWYVTLRTESPLAVTLVTITTFLPQALVMLYGGVLADRYPPKGIVMLADSAIALTTLILAFLFLSGINHIGWLLFFNSLRSFGAGIQMPASKSILPILVPEKELMRANSIYTSIWCVIQLISPGLSGAILGYISIVGVFFIDVVTAIMGVGLLAVIAMPVREKKTDKYQPIDELKSGVHYIKSNPRLKNSILFYSFFSLLVVPASQLTPLLASQKFGDKIWVLSTIETAFSVGALLVSLFLAYKKIETEPFKLVGLSAVLFGLVMILLIPSNNIILFTVLMLVMGIGSPLYYTPLTTHIQEITEEAYMGRTFSFVDLSSSIAIPLGMILFGPLARVNIMLSFVIPGALLMILGARTKAVFKNE